MVLSSWDERVTRGGWPLFHGSGYVPHEPRELPLRRRPAVQRDGLEAPVDVGGRDWRRLLANRETDLATRDLVGLVRLSVATDRIGLAAMRCAGLLARLAAGGRRVDRSGAGVVVEVHPAAALQHWGLPFRGYKGAANAAMRDGLVDRLAAAEMTWVSRRRLTAPGDRSPARWPH